MELCLSPVHIDTLWQQFQETRQGEIREKLSLHYLGVVRSVVRSMNVKTTPPLEESDLEQIGFIGLGDAIDRFDPTRGVRFETYAQPRIRGTIWDELRRLDWVPRSVREQAMKYRRAAEAAEAGREGEATSEEILAALATMGGGSEVAVREIESLDRDADERDGEAMLLRDTIPSGDDDVLALLIAHETRREVTRMVMTLPAAQRRVILAHYFEEMPFIDVAKELRVTAARVSQIHKQALATLGGKLRELIN